MRTPAGALTWIFAGIAIASLSACAGGNSNDPSDFQSNTAQTHTKPTPELALVAMEKAEADVASGAVFDLDSGHSPNGKLVWNLKVASGTKSQHSVRVSQDGKTILKNDKDKELDDDVALLAEAKLSATQAVKRATKDHKGQVTALEIEGNAQHQIVWNVTLNNNGSLIEYTLDADTGKTQSSAPVKD